MSREYALSVRLAADDEKITTPPATPRISVSASSGRTLEASSARARMRMAVISFGPQDYGRPGPGRGATGEGRNHVGQQDGSRHDQQRSGEREGHRRRDSHLVR